MQVGDDLVVGGALGAMIFEEWDGPGPRQGDWNGPVAKLAAVNLGPGRLAADPVAVVGEAEPIEVRHDPLVRVEPGRGEAGRPSEVAHEMAVGFIDVGPEVFVRQLVEAPAPDDVIHAPVEPQLVAFLLQRLQGAYEGEPHRPGERRLQQEARPASLLDEVDRLPVGQLGLGALHALAQPLAQVGRAAHVDEEGVGDAEVSAHRTNPGQAIGDADPVVHIPAEGEHPLAHRRTSAPMSR